MLFTCCLITGRLHWTAMERSQNSSTSSLRNLWTTAKYVYKHPGVTRFYSICLFLLEGNVLLSVILLPQCCYSLLCVFLSWWDLRQGSLCVKVSCPWIWTLNCESHRQLNSRWWGTRFIYINMIFLINIETWRSVCQTYPMPSLLACSEWTQWTEEQFRHFWWCHHLWRHRRRSRIYRWRICTGWPRVSI